MNWESFVDVRFPSESKKGYDDRISYEEVKIILSDPEFGDADALARLEREKTRLDQLRLSESA